MPDIIWESLVVDGNGVIDYVRVRNLVSVTLALSGGIAIVLAMLGLITPGDYVILGASSLVLPLTGGKIAEAIVAGNGSSAK